MAREDAKAGQDAVDRDAWYESRKTILERCPKNHERVYRIHPSIGFARVGNSPDQFFIGAENDAYQRPERFFTLPADRTKMPKETLVSASADKTIFKDKETKAGQPIGDRGRIRRQAARFRVIEYMTCKPGRGKKPDWKWTREITTDEARITWKVEVANKKAAFYEYSGPNLSAARSGPTIEPKPAKMTVRFGFDPKKHPASHKVLEDPGKLISYLGEILHDEKGRLIFLGGRGEAKGPVGSAIGDYANNAGWVDDVSDGEINAIVNFPGKGHRYDTKKMPDSKLTGDAWVMVGPPDFGPELTNITSLYDLMLDIAVHDMTPGDDNKVIFDMHGVTDRKDAAYQPHFEHDLLRLFDATYQTATVFKPANPPMKHPAVYKLAKNTHLDDPTESPADVAAGLEPKKHLRYKVFNTLRPADEGRLRLNAADPRVPATFEPPPAKPLHADAAKQAAEIARYEKYRWTMPLLWNDFDPSYDTTRFSVTRLQFKVCKAWYEGKFTDTTYDSFDKIPRSTAITPGGLDRAALDRTVGGPFFPGIEASWLTRAKEIYVEPFRVKRGEQAKEITYGPFKSTGVAAAGAKVKVAPGFFSQQMAQPWHADFYACARAANVGWWPAQRPDDVVRGDVEKADPKAMEDVTPVKRDGRSAKVWKGTGESSLLTRARNATLTVGGAKPEQGPQWVEFIGVDEAGVEKKQKIENLPVAGGTTSGAELYVVLKEVKLGPGRPPALLEATVSIGIAADGANPPAPAAPAALLGPTTVKSAGGDAGALDPTGNAALAKRPRKVLFTTGGAKPEQAPLTATVEGLDAKGNPAAPEIVTLPRAAGTATTKAKLSAVTKVTYAKGEVPEELEATTTIGFGEFVGDMQDWAAGVTSMHDNTIQWWRLGFVVNGVEVERDPNL